MIQAVIFDCFGVLTTDGWLAFREKYFDDRPDLRERAIDSVRRVDAGLISYEELYREIADLAAVSVQQVMDIIEGNTTNERLFEYIRDELKPHYKIGMLSNAGDNWLDRLFVPWQIDLFDEIVLSYEVGVTKPDPRMYQTVTNRLGVLPEECIYIDDVERYVTSAADLGMHAIYFKDTSSTISKIEELRSARTT